MFEAISTVTPVVACPLTFDQHANGEILENLGVAIKLDIDFITEEKVLSAINAIVNDTK